MRKKVVQKCCFVLFYFEIKKKKVCLFINKFRLFDHEIVISYRSKYEKKMTKYRFNNPLTIDRLHSKNVYDKRRHSSGTNSLNFSSDKHSFGVCPNCKIMFERNNNDQQFVLLYNNHSLTSTFSSHIEEDHKQHVSSCFVHRNHNQQDIHVWVSRRNKQTKTKRHICMQSLSISFFSLSYEFFYLAKFLFLFSAVVFYIQNI